MERTISVDVDEAVERVAQHLHGSDFWGSPGRHTDRKDGGSYRKLDWDQLYEQKKVSYRGQARRALNAAFPDMDWGRLDV